MKPKSNKKKEELPIKEQNQKELSQPEFDSIIKTLLEVPPEHKKKKGISAFKQEENQR